MAITQVTVTGTLNRAPGAAASGLVLWRLSADLFQSGAPVATTAPIRAQLDETGAFSVDLWANDDPTTEPVGTYWTFSGVVDGVPVYEKFVISHSMAPAIDLADLTPAAVSDPVFPVNAVQLQSRPVSGAAPTAGQVLEFDGTAWAPGAGAGDATKLQGQPVSATAPSSGQVLEFDGSSWAPGAGSAKAVSVDDAGRPSNAAGQPLLSALLFDGNPKSSFHNRFWIPGINLGTFLWEFLVRYDGNSVGQGYIISEGFGGNHAILYGLAPTPSGNIYNGTTNISFVGDYQAQVGEWLHTAVGWDGTFIYLWVNGCLVGITAFAGPRRAQASMGQLFLGGSDHSNFQGAIAAARAYEYPSGGKSMPILGTGNVWGAYTPDLSCSPYIVGGGTLPSDQAQFAVDFMHAFSQTVEDKGLGYGGAKHPGALVFHNPNGQSNLVPQYVYDPDLAALFANYPPVQNRTPPAPVAAPSGAKIFDSFGRADTTPLWVPQSGGLPVCTLGSTEGGSLGPLAWATLTTTAHPFGVFNGAAVMCSNAAIAAGQFVLNDSPDMDLQVTRKNATGYAPAFGSGTSATGADIGVAFRVQDTSNFWYATTYHDQFNNYVNIFSKVGGAATSVVRWNLPNSTWKTLRVVTSGTTITGYVDDGGAGWTQIGQLTGQSALATATGVGIWYSGGGTAVRFDQVAVF